MVFVSSSARLGAWLLLAWLFAATDLRSQSLSFSDQTAFAGLTCTHTPPGGVASSPMLSGGSVADFNRDGFLDLFVVGGGGAADLLFINNGDGTFTDRAAAWQVDALHVGGGSAVGDFDRDGWVDLFVASHGPPSNQGPGHHRLYRNTGHNSFTEVAALAGVQWASPTVGDGYSATFGDYDADGHLDLFVTSWMTGANGNRLFHNNRDGTFTDVTASAFGSPTALDSVHGFSAQFADMNGDRHPELLLAADFGTSRYFVNNGDGSFTDATAASGTGQDSNGMGQTLGDFDGDGRLDWYVTSIWSDAGLHSGNMLYLNQGAHTYLESSVQRSVRNGGWGWGTVAADFDHDGDLDLAETNGWVTAEWFNEPSYLFLNNGTGSFFEASAAHGLNHIDAGRGLLHFDADNDGDQDLVIFSIGGPLKFFRNDLSGPNRNWLRVTLSSGGNPVAPGGYGAQVRLSAQGRSQVRCLPGGSSFLSTSEQSAHFGLGSAPRVDEVAIAWPNGTTTYLTDVTPNQTVNLTCCSGWTALDGALPGAFGTPQLDGQGTLIAGEPVSLRVTNALPNRPCLLVLGTLRADLPLLGGTLVPRPDLLMFPLFTNAAGSLTLFDNWPGVLPPGDKLFGQAWISDPAGPLGASATNGLMIEAP